MSELNFQIPRDFTRRGIQLVFHPEVPKLDFVFQILVARYALAFLERLRQISEPEVKRYGFPKNSMSLPVQDQIYQDPELLGVEMFSECLDGEVITPERFMK
ncbi:MAG: hypothetical protein LBQ11_01920, partial [Candidatus Nomurabacteria bacterium]|nr:hypothetical protein [Candidatus Nomurabacteria bacterium]